TRLREPQSPGFKNFLRYSKACPETLEGKPPLLLSIINSSLTHYQLSTNPLSTIHSQLSTLNYQLSTLHYQLLTIQLLQIHLHFRLHFFQFFFQVLYFFLYGFHIDWFFFLKRIDI